MFMKEVFYEVIILICRFYAFLLLSMLLNRDTFLSGFFDE